MMKTIIYNLFSLVVSKIFETHFLTEQTRILLINLHTIVQNTKTELNDNIGFILLIFFICILISLLTSLFILIFYVTQTSTFKEWKAKLYLWFMLVPFVESKFVQQIKYKLLFHKWFMSNNANTQYFWIFCNWFCAFILICLIPFYPTLSIIIFIVDCLVFGLKYSTMNFYDDIRNEWAAFSTSYLVKYTLIFSLFFTQLWYVNFYYFFYVFFIYSLFAYIGNSVPNSLQFIIFCRGGGFWDFLAWCGWKCGGVITQEEIDRASGAAYLKQYSGDPVKRISPNLVGYKFVEVVKNGELIIPICPEGIGNFAPEIKKLIRDTYAIMFIKSFIDTDILVKEDIPTIINKVTFFTDPSSIIKAPSLIKPTVQQIIESHLEQHNNSKVVVGKLTNPNIVVGKLINPAHVPDTIEGTYHYNASRNILDLKNPD